MVGERPQGPPRWGQGECGRDTASEDSPPTHPHRSLSWALLLTEATTAGGTIQPEASLLGKGRGQGCWLEGSHGAPFSGFPEPNSAEAAVGRATDSLGVYLCVFECGCVRSCM